MTKTLRCYEIHDLIREVMDRAVDPDTGELTDSGIAELHALSSAANHSAADLACYIRELELEAESVKSVLAEMAKRAVQLENRAAKWRAVLLETMDSIGSTGIKDARITVAVRANPPSVNIDDVDELPILYCRVIPLRIEPDKTAIKAALKSGETIPGVSLVSTRRVVIQ